MTTCGSSPMPNPPRKQKPATVRMWAVALVAATLSTACGPDTGVADEASQEVLVSAAASLTDAFTDIEASYESANPGIDVVLNLAGSSALRTQILEGAPVDVFASANTANMDQVVDAGLTAGEPVIFVENLLQIAVPTGNPADVTALADFADDDLLIGLCAEEVPCGDFAREAFAKAGVDPAIDSNEPDVRSLLTKIEAGELDAGITYVTDVTAAGGTVEGVDIPDELNVVARYPIAVIDAAPNGAGAEAFVRFVLSEEGRAILAGYGFASP